MIESPEKKEDSFIKIGEASEILGVSKPTLRHWHATGELVPVYVSLGGSRYYTRKQIREFLEGRKK